MLFFVNSRNLALINVPWAKTLRGGGSFYEFNSLQYRANAANSMDPGQPIKWNHRWKITRINVKFCA